MISLWDKEYPTHIEIPEDYWVYSCDIEYSLDKNDKD